MREFLKDKFGIEVTDHKLYRARALARGKGTTNHISKFRLLRLEFRVVAEISFYKSFYLL